MKCNGIILAGGKSSRFGSNKALFKFNGKVLLSHSIDLLQNICCKIIVSGDKNQYKNIDANFCSDIVKGIGPIGGIYSCLRITDNDLNLIIPCDMPLIKEGLLKKLLDQYENESISVFMDTNKRIYPFPMFIHKKYETLIKELIHNRCFKLMDLIENGKTQYIRISNNDIKYLLNVNYKENIEAIQNNIYD